MMNLALDQLLQKGVRLKRAGDLEGAKKCYIDALEINPHHHMAYIGLGKVAYLLRNRNLALRSYLCAVHLQLSPIEKRINENNLPFHLKIQYESFPKNILMNLPKKSAFTIFIDPNTPRHIAHSLIDLEPEMFADKPYLEPYANIYRAHIHGDGTHDSVLQNYGMTSTMQIEGDENLYIPCGREFILDELKWNSLSNTNVLELYFMNS